MCMIVSVFRCTYTSVHVHVKADVDMRYLLGSTPDNLGGALNAPIKPFTLN